MNKHKGIVIIPCWNRPEFLGACLHYIQKADGWENYLYYFAIDRKADPLNMQVISTFKGEYLIRQAVMHRYNGNSYNLLSAYSECYLLAKDWEIPLVYLIEEDIFIGKDFFTFHEEKQAVTDAFFVTACRNHYFKQGENINKCIIHPSKF